MRPFFLRAAGHLLQRIERVGGSFDKEGLYVAWLIGHVGAGERYHRWLDELPRPRFFHLPSGGVMNELSFQLVIPVIILFTCV